MNFNNTNWNLYKSFLAVYETQSFHRAAEILGISHSAVWQNIKTLGEQLGFALFVSHRKGTLPTGDANNLYPTIKKAIDLIVSAEDNSQEFGADSSAVIKIGITGPIIEYSTLDYLKEFHIKYPKVRLEFYRRDIMEMLESGKLDFVIELAGVVGATGVKKIDLFTLNGAFIASKQFLEKRGLTRKISRDDFLRLPMISFHMYADIYKQIDASAEPLIIKADSINMIHFLAKNSVGIGYYCKELLGNLNDPDLVEVTVENVTLPVIEVACGYNSLSRSAKVFVDGLVKVLN